MLAGELEAAEREVEAEGAPIRLEQRQVGPSAAAAVESREIPPAAGSARHPGIDEPTEAAEPEVPGLGLVGQFEQAVHVTWRGACRRAEPPCYHSPSMRSRGLAEALAVLLAGFVLTTALTYPLVPGAAHLGRVNTDDGRLSIWNVAWVAEALLTDPAHLYDANIFYPAQHALAFSEANIAAGVLGLPAWALTGNPYLAHNFAAIVAFVASFAGMYYLARYLTGVPRGSSGLGGAVRVLPVHLRPHRPHQLLMTGGLPFAMLAFHASSTARRRCARSRWGWCCGCRRSPAPTTASSPVWSSGSARCGAPSPAGCGRRRAYSGSARARRVGVDQP